MSESTGEARRGMGPSTHRKIEEITSGRANSQQGYAETLPRLVAQGDKPRLREGFGLAHEPV
ncbi:MAG TPA: hypothetical protein DCP92_07825 [Nitrospiraceae bacterium]|nr:hypothetical protein [Nitrospiraceae bacterium]